MAVQIIQAQLDDLTDLVPLFDAYRQFYGAHEDLTLARKFLLERFQSHDSTILLARSALCEAVGFTQLYPSFTSVGCVRIYILNDLFVSQAHRGRGAAAALLDAAAEFGRKMDAARLTLSTAVDNHIAQTLYEKLGWRRNEAFTTYNLAL